MKNLLTALIAAKSAFTAIRKDKKGNYGKYASLDAILEAIEPALLENGLLLSHSMVDGHLTTSLYHSSGEQLGTCIKLPEVTDPQKIGSAISYYRRYSICCLLSVCADEDDDAQVSSDASKKLAKSAPIALLRDDAAAIANYRKDLINCFAELGWTTEQQKSWAVSFDARGSNEWSLAVWRSALAQLSSEVDKLLIIEAQA